MRLFLAVLFCAFSLQAQAATLRYELRFEGDNVFELQRDFFGEVCRFGQDCYPDDFRLGSGFFAGLSIGETTTATVDFNAGTAHIAEYEVPGILLGYPTPPNAQIFEPGYSLAEFSASRVHLQSEGPIGNNPGSICYPSRPTPGLPDGFCGFYGYEASFEVLSISEIPLPASGLLLIGGLGLFGLWRLRRS